MRVGQNPAKSIEHVSKPREITAAVIVYIPFLSGYYAQSMDVLNICLSSMRKHANIPYDLMVFDNASCLKVVDYLKDLQQAGQIQYLILSDKNIGKVGAWNFIFGASPGEFIAYADSDVYFYPEWISKHLEIFKAFPEVGTVSGLPRRGRRTFYHNTIQQGEEIANVKFEEGKFIPESWIIDHARSLGKLDTVHEILELNDYRFTRNNVSAFATATHFQFMVRRKTIQEFIPFPYNRPMGDSVAHFDHAINNSNLLRLAVTERVVKHMGNTLDEKSLSEFPPYLNQNITPEKRRYKNQLIFFMWKPVKWILHRLYNWIFQIYYSSGKNRK